MKSISKLYNDAKHGTKVSTSEEFITFGLHMLESLGISKYQALITVKRIANSTRSITSMLERFDTIVSAYKTDVEETPEVIISKIMESIVNNEKLNISLIERAVDKDVNESLRLFMYHASKILKLADAYDNIDMGLYEHYSCNSFESNLKTPMALMYSIDALRKVSKLLLTESKKSDEICIDDYQRLVYLYEQSELIKSSYVDSLEKLSTEYLSTIQLFNSMVSSTNSNSYYYSLQKLKDAHRIHIDAFIYLCMNGVLNKLLEFNDHLIQVYGNEKCNFLKNVVSEFASINSITLPLDGIERNLSFSAIYTCIDRMINLVQELNSGRSLVLDFVKVSKPIVDYLRINSNKLYNIMDQNTPIS